MTYRHSVCYFRFSLCHRSVYLWSNLQDNRVYSGMGYFLDHAVNHHPNIAADKYQNIQKVLNTPDEVKAIVDNGNNSIVFIKQIDRYNAVVIEVEKTDDGRIVWHKSFYDQNKKPYANKGTRLYEMSSEGGISPIIRTDASAHDSSLSVLDDAAKIQQNNGTAKSVDNYLRPEADFSNVIDENGNKYYDQALTEIEKGNLIEIANGFISTEAEPNPSVTAGKDTKLISILQTSSSKVVDENGEPLVVYHGTNRNTHNRFFKFNTENGAVWVTQAKGYANIFAEDGNGKATLYQLFADIHNPAYVGYIGSRLDDGELQRLAKNLNIPLTELENAAGQATYVYELTASKPFADLIGRYGYDGIQAREAAFDTYAALSPSQIKSATDNNGSFDESNDDIRFSISDYTPDHFTAAQQLATNTVLDALKDAGIPVEVVSQEEAQRVLENKQSDNSARLMLQMEQGTKEQSNYPIDGTKLQQNLEKTKQTYKNKQNNRNSAISDIA